MVRKADLKKRAAEFARDSLEHLLNTTITNGIPIGAALTADGRCVVGFGVNKKNFAPNPIPVTISSSEPRCYLYLIHNLFLAESGYLAVADSSYAVYLNADLSEASQIVRYDYERDKEGYPPAHVQVYGQSDALAELFARARRGRHLQLERVHFPVGGKRYRPCLEDVIEFLVREQLVEAHPNWESSLNEHRNEFHRRQLSAAVLADPETARKALEEHDAK